MWYKKWCAEIDKPPMLHRKHWEWAAIAQALSEREVLGPDKRGLGFAVGDEALPSLFASLGSRVDATDIAEGGDGAKHWIKHGQHAKSTSEIFKPKIIPKSEFDRLVQFFPVDMRDLSDLRPDTYDFIWSSCAMEHLGDLSAGTKFVLESAKLLKPGGVAAHTTEFNLSHLHNTIESGQDVLYRESDLRQLDFDLRRQFCCLEELDLFPGTRKEDVCYDYPPFYTNGHSHVKLLLHNYVCTSVILIVRRWA